MRSACSAIEVAAAGERGTAEVKLADARSDQKALRLLAQRVYAKTLPKLPLESVVNSSSLTDENVVCYKSC